MNWLSTSLVLCAAFLSVFWSAAFGGVRQLLGAQIDFLPCLMVYASLHTGLKTMCALAVLGGLWFDSLSANPLGISILPLFSVGLVLSWVRDLVLRDEIFAQLLLGLGASATVPVLTLVLLLSSGHSPLFSWGTFWQLFVMAVGGAAATPVWFTLFGWFENQLLHRRDVQTSFRSDREIRRGRV